MFIENFLRFLTQISPLNFQNRISHGLSEEDFDKPLISTYYLYTLYKQLAKNLGLSKSSEYIPGFSIFTP